MLEQSEPSILEDIDPFIPSKTPVLRRAWYRPLHPIKVPLPCAELRPFSFPALSTGLLLSEDSSPELLEPEMDYSTIPKNNAAVVVDAEPRFDMEWSPGVDPDDLREL